MVNKKNNLAELLKEQTTVPKERVLAKAGEGTKPTSTPRVKEEKKPTGRPPKTPQELRNEKLTLSLTKAEREILKKKAGLVPEAVFVLKHLQDSNFFTPGNK